MKKPTSIPKLVLTVGIIFSFFGSTLMSASNHVRRIPQPDGTIKHVIELTNGNKLCLLIAWTGLAMILGSGSYMAYRKIRGNS